MCFQEFVFTVNHLKQLEQIYKVAVSAQLSAKSLIDDYNKHIAKDVIKNFWTPELLVQKLTADS